jgi:hypothetical protein
MADSARVVPKQMEPRTPTVASSSATKSTPSALTSASTSNYDVTEEELVAIFPDEPVPPPLLGSPPPSPAVDERARSPPRRAACPTSPPPPRDERAASPPPRAACTASPPPPRDERAASPPRADPAADADSDGPFERAASTASSSPRRPPPAPPSAPASRLHAYAARERAALEEARALYVLAKRRVKAQRRDVDARRGFEPDWMVRGDVAQLNRGVHTIRRVERWMLERDVLLELLDEALDAGRRRGDLGAAYRVCDDLAKHAATFWGPADAPPPPKGKARRARHRSLPPAWAAYERPTDALVARPAEPSQRATVDGHIAWLRGFSGKLGEFRSV